VSAEEDFRISILDFRFQGSGKNFVAGRRSAQITARFVDPSRVPAELICSKIENPNSKIA